MAHVLVIEDDQDIREAIDRLLSLSGHAVRLCANALDGLRELASGSPDVVVLDLNLPDLDGAAVLRRIRASSAAARPGDNWRPSPPCCSRPDPRLGATFPTNLSRPPNPTC